LTGFLRIGKAATLLVAAFSASASEANSTEQRERFTVYRCELQERVPQGGSGDLWVIKTFREDGSVYDLSVTWNDNSGSFVRLKQRGDSAMATLHWPGEHQLYLEPRPFDWRRGSIEINFFGADGAARYRPSRNEKWLQVIVDRNRSLTIHEVEGRRLLFPSGPDLHLASELEPTGSPGKLNMSLDGFLAWGANAESVTVYETLVTSRTPKPNAYPDTPIASRRIIGEYDVDIAGLSEIVNSVRARTEQWERSAENFRSCRKDVEGGEVIVTGIAQAGAAAS
jgi:hypothetical protein